MTAPILPADPPFDGLPPAHAALFLDFDGVLVDLAAGPDAIVVPAALRTLLPRLETALGGALAIVSGRAVADLERHIGPLPGWVAGSHGGERRRPGQADAPHPLTAIDRVAVVQRRVKTLAQFGTAILVEIKPLGAVVHYRGDPSKEDVLRRAAEEIAAHSPGFECHPAKMAFELRPRDVGKDKVVADWLQRAPFRGRTPVYFGDDLTDEPALGMVQAAGGRAIKVGKGPSVARHRLDSPTEVLATLTRWLDDHRS
jgi:trehalose 6-phosphate phosphatase